MLAEVQSYYSQTLKAKESAERAWEILTHLHGDTDDRVHQALAVSKLKFKPNNLYLTLRIPCENL